MNNHFAPVALLLIASILGACAHPTIKATPEAVIGEPGSSAAELGLAPALVGARDSRIDVSVDKIIVRNGLESWANDAHWDEYRFRVRSISGRDLHVLRIRLYDALGRPIESRAERGELIDATREVAAEYEKRGDYTKLRRDAPPYSWGPFLPVSPTAGAGLIVMSPAIVVIDSVTRLVHARQVSDELKRRQTLLPATAGREYVPVVTFFPIVPRPSAIEISYRDGEEEGCITITTPIAPGSLDGAYPR
jgi:hypothetical protein